MIHRISITSQSHSPLKYFTRLYFAVIFQIPKQNFTIKLLDITKNNMKSSVLYDSEGLLNYNISRSNHCSEKC